MKKNFKSQNPALQYINADQQIESPKKMEITTDTHVYTDTYTDTYTHVYAHSDQAVLLIPKESKSRRLQLLIKPSTYSEIADSAKKNGVSVNDAINRILENHLKKNRQSELE